MTLLEQLKQHAEVRVDEPLRLHTTYKIGGPADYFIMPSSPQDLAEIVSILNNNSIPFFVLGKGSNVLISDRPYHGAVISTVHNFDSYEFDDENKILTADAGCSLILLAHKAAEHNLGGLEFASGIPGSVGGALFMNAGAYNAAMSDILLEVQVLKDGELVWMKPEELNYTYRHSEFQKHRDWTILKARFQMVDRDKADIHETMESRKQRRMASQPYDKPCAGSVFRNPEGMNAWKIVDSLGYRGKSCGGAVVSPKHSNFIVNDDGSASASDVDRLIREIQEKAREEFGVELITEVERINWE